MSDTGDSTGNPGPPGRSRRVSPRDPNRLSGIVGKALGRYNDPAIERSFNRTFGSPAPSYEGEVSDEGEAYDDDDDVGSDGDVSEVISFPDSSRCAAARYHHRDQKLLMSWTNGKTPWIYHDVPVSVYTSFLSARSPGGYVNAVLNEFTHNRLVLGDRYSKLVYGVMPGAM